MPPAGSSVAFPKIYTKVMENFTLTADNRSKPHFEEIL